MHKGKKIPKFVHKIMGSELILDKTENKTFHCKESGFPTLFCLCILKRTQKNQNKCLKR